MRTVRAPIPVLAVVLTLGGCAGTKQMPSLSGEGGSAVLNTGGSPGATGGAAGSVATTSGAGGSGTGGDVGITGSGGTGANCGLYQFQPTPKNADIMMVLDRSGSMKDVPDGAPSGSTTTKWQIVVPAMEEMVRATQSSISWGLKTFPEAYDRFDERLRGRHQQGHRRAGDGDGRHADELDHLGAPRPTGTARPPPTR